MDKLPLLNGMTKSQKIELIQLIEEKQRRENVYRYKRFYKSRYPWQKKFIAATAQFTQVALIAANRTGKTDTGTGIDAIHAMGDYPEGWDGHKFDHAPLIWCLGYSGEKCRDLLQTPILGRRTDNGWDGGLIPGELIVDTEPMQGTPNAVRSAYIRHKSGQLSKIQFWSYSQGQHALMGDAVDWFHIDEEPKDATIYPQVLTRTATGDKGNGGRGILTFTPENGRTDLVIAFMDNPSSGQHCMNVGWDDAPHLSEKVKKDLLESYPPHQRDMRTKGIPMLGHGRIYDLSEDFIKCDPFPIPDHWLVIDGMDFGWDHPQAHVQLAWDIENEAFYLTRAYKARQVSPAEAFSAVKAWAYNVPTAWPPDGLQTEKGSGLQQKSYYEEAGFLMLPEHAQWEDGSRAVEPGLFEIYDLMRRGKFRVFSGLRDFFEEYNFYHRDEKGKIVKVRDDILDAVRYAYMMRRYAIRFADIKNPPVEEDVYVPSSSGW
ncbi:terminase large subunit domain-containing protein [Enterobacter roggenkampii]|uniref:phage terminase large subunit family protein n=1 Tax=Enterobacter roggenkampii TaxID=1812935 RepID=UPI0020037167|nr:terminase family protein [Enterobacter roggenkampii]MCK6840513.1 terminase family protein [Enterobacter roggenkampii]